MGLVLTQAFFRVYNKTQEVRIMIGLNDQIKTYMIKYEWKDIVLYVEKYTS